MLIIEKLAVPLHPQTGCSAVGSALRSGRRGRAFESPHPDSTKRRQVQHLSALYLLLPLYSRDSYLSLTCPSPSIIHLYVVISSNAMGPHGPSFCVLMPISAPSPNCAPSVKLVGAFQYTHAASTDCRNRCAAVSSDVIIASLCPEP